MNNEFQVKSIFENRSTTEYRSYSSISYIKVDEHPIYLTSHEENLSKNKNENWTYSINKYGFRNQYCETPVLPCIGFYGCSNTFGIGVEDKYVTSEVFKNNTANLFEVYNFGIPGCGITRTCDIFCLSAELLPIKAAVFTMPSYFRYMIIPEDVKLYIDLMPNYEREEYSKFSRYLYSTLSDKSFISLMVQNIDRALMVAQKKNIKVYMCSWEDVTDEVIKEKYSNEVNHIRFVAHTDSGRDGLHPGPLTHTNYALYLADMIKRDFGYSDV